MRKTVSVLAVLALVAAFAVPSFAEEAKPDGKALFASKCAMCHGADGVAKAMAKGSRNFNDAKFDASAEEITKVILGGKGKMPKNEGKLSMDQAQAIAAYVKTMAPKK